MNLVLFKVRWVSEGGSESRGKEKKALVMVSEESEDGSKSTGWLKKWLLIRRRESLGGRKSRRWLKFSLFMLSLILRCWREWGRESKA